MRRKICSSTLANATLAVSLLSVGLLALTLLPLRAAAQGSTFRDCDPAKVSCTPQPPAKSCFLKPNPSSNVALSNGEHSKADDKCNALEEHAKLARADSERADLHLDKAAEQYLALLKSCDADTQKHAVWGLTTAHNLMSTWWWQEGRYFPPFRWYHVHYPRFWWVLFWFLVISLVVFYSTNFRLFQYFRPTFTAGWRKFVGLIFADTADTTYIMGPSKLTNDTQQDLFAALLQNKSAEIHQVLERAGGARLGVTTLLILPSTAPDSVAATLPNVKGVDLASFVKFFLYLKRYLGSRVESQVGYCPALMSTDGKTVLAPPRLIASATLRRKWQTRGGPWSMERVVQSQYDVDAVAFALAARIMGTNRGR